MNIKRSLAILALIALCGSANAAVESLKDISPKLASENEEVRTEALKELQGFLTSACAPGAEAERARMARLLADAISDAAVPQLSRIAFLRQLEYVGAGESVPALTALLESPDVETRECARRALEKNSDASASINLRNALKKSEDAKWKLGLVNSLGQRRDAASVKEIESCLNDPILSETASLALARIANDDAIKALAVRIKEPHIAEALIEAANSSLKDGKMKQAEPAFKAVYAEGTSAAVRSAALQGLAKSDPKGSRKLVLEALSNAEPRIQFAAIQSAPTAFGKELADTLSPLLPKFSPAIKARALGLLDATAEKIIIEASKDEQEIVRIAAVESLGRIGTKNSLTAVLGAYASDSRAVKITAESALAAMPDDEVNKAIDGFMAEGETKLRAAAMAAAAIRNRSSAAPALMQYAGEVDGTISKAACGALRVLGGETQMEPLAQLYSRTASSDVLNALQAVAGRAANKASASAKLVEIAKKGETKAVAGLLTVVGTLGDSSAIDPLIQYAGNANEDTANAAIRALGNWPNFSASKALLKIAASADFKQPQQSEALQGLARLVEASETETPQARLDAALPALKAAARTEDKKQLLTALGTVPHPKAAEPILEALNDASLKNEAGVAGASLAVALTAIDKDAAQELAKKIKAANISREVNQKVDRVLRR